MTKGSDSREFFELFKTPPKTEHTQKEENKPAVESTDLGQKRSAPNVGQYKPVVTPGVSAQNLNDKITRKEDTSIKEKPEQPKVVQAPAVQATVEHTQSKDELIIRQETLIIGAIAATFLSIACFFVGYKVGYNRGTTGQAAEGWLDTVEPQNVKQTMFGQPKQEEVTQKIAVKVQPVKVEKQPAKVEKPPVKVEKQPEPPAPIAKDKWTLRVVSYRNTPENVKKAREITKILKDAVGYEACIVTGKDKEIFVCVGQFESSNSDDLLKAQKIIVGLKYENKTPFDGCYPVSTVRNK